jgi:hypothetical protein
MKTLNFGSEGDCVNSLSEWATAWALHFSKQSHYTRTSRNIERDVQQNLGRKKRSEYIVIENKKGAGRPWRELKVNRCKRRFLSYEGEEQCKQRCDVQQRS